MFLDCLSQERVDGEVVPLQAPWQGQWGDRHSHIKWFNPQDSLAERYCEAHAGAPSLGMCCSDREGDPCSSVSDVKSLWLVSLGLGSSSPSLQSEQLAQHLPVFHISQVWNLSDGQQCGPGSLQLGGAPGGPHSEVAGHQEGRGQTGGTKACSGGALTHCTSRVIQLS